MMLNTASTPRARKTLGALLAGTLALAAAGAVWAANAPEPTVALPVWVQRPSGEDMTRYYPEAALKAGVMGAKVIVDCGITAEGRLDNCLVRTEDPVDYGFGEATVKLARHFQMAPEDRDGKPTAGGVVRIPIVFYHGPAA